MKLLTTFLLVFMIASPIISYPSSSEEYANSSEEEEKRSTKLVDTTTTTTKVETTTVETTTTTTTVSPISYEVHNLIEKLPIQFNELKDVFTKNQQDIYDKVWMDLENYKLLRDSSIKSLKDVYEHEILESKNILKSLNDKKLAIEKSIDKVFDGSWNNEENARKLEDLKSQNKLLNNKKSNNCEDCDGSLTSDQIDAEILKNDNKIAELEEQKIQKQGNEIEIRTRKLNDDETRELNAKYLELIHVYKKEIEEHKKIEKLELINTIINDKWKNYVEKLHYLQNKMRAKIENLANKSIKLKEFSSNDDSYDNNYEVFKTIPDSFKWIDFNKNKDVPSDAVEGGRDTDGSKLYVIRSGKDDEYLYGKYAVSSGRKDVYVTDNKAETSASDFQILVSKNYLWCDAKTYKFRENAPPVCTTTHYYDQKEIKLPGTLLKNGECRVGFAWNIHTYTNNVKILGFGSCNKTASLTDLNFWFR